MTAGASSCDDQYGRCVPGDEARRGGLSGDASAAAPGQVMDGRAEKMCGGLPEQTRHPYGGLV